MDAVRAVVHRDYGDPERALGLVEVQRPAPGRSEVLVDVHASTVSDRDRLRLLGRPLRSRLRRGLVRPDGRVLGTDFAGRVAVADAAGPLPVGTDVFGWCAGALAEVAIASTALVTSRPRHLTPEQAAVAPTAGTTALRAVRDGGAVRSGDQVLVIGASGGVGTFAVQIAVAFGADVTGVCSTTNCELVRAIGARRTIDYTLDDLRPPRGGWDVVIDLVGARPIRDLRRTVSPTGTLVLVAHDRPALAPGLRGTAARARASGSRQRVRALVPRRDRADLDELRSLMEAGAVVPIVSAHYPLAEVATALAHFAPGHARGQVAISV